MNNLRKRASGVFQFNAILIAALLLMPSCASAREVINNFNVDARILQDSPMVDVNESITIDFGHHLRHGLERVYEPSQQINIVSVEDETGTKYDTSISKPDDKTQLRIGSPQKTMSGTHTYNIHYTIQGAIARDGVLNWSPTGHYWKQPIQNFQLKLTSETKPVSSSANTKPQYLPIDSRGIYYLNAKDGGEFHISANNLRPGTGVDVSANLGPNYHPTISTMNAPSISGTQNQQSSSSFAGVLMFVLIGIPVAFSVWMISMMSNSDKNTSWKRSSDYSGSSCGSSSSSCSSSSSSCSSSSCGGGSSW